jgi:Holliday junction resolvase
MKRQSRNPLKFDTLELFSALSRDAGFRMDTPDDIEAFHQKIGESLKASLSNSSLLHGKRVEAMFAHVAGAMGRCKYITHEDGGSAFVASDDFVAPDYRLVTQSDELFLVEVKNFHMKRLSERYRMKRLYLNKLAAYAKINRAELRIAIYFSRVNQWTLLSPESFFEENEELWIDLPHALARSEMSVIGDRQIATFPLLRFEMLCDQDGDKPPISDDGTAKITIREVHMYCADKRLENSMEGMIAFYLMRYGDWEATQDPVVIADGFVSKVSFSLSPREPTIDQEFEIVGSLSSMVSNAFRELTVSDDAGIVSLDVKYDPSFFQLKIPEDYKGKGLPIWQFIIQPNPEFSA